MSEIRNAYPDTIMGAYLKPYNYFNGQIRNIITGEVYAGTIHDLPRYDIQRIRIVTEAYRDVPLDRFVTNNMKYFLSAHGTAIITHKRARKENALRKFAEYFNIPESDVVAFGDDTNDAEMIKIAGTGVAMGNAIDEVKSVADFVCDTNDNDGVAKWINSFLL